MNVTVLGAGAWGTALGLILHHGHHQVTLWGHDPKHLEQLRQTRRNDRYLAGVELPPEWVLSADLKSALDGSECAECDAGCTTWHSHERTI